MLCVRVRVFGDCGIVCLWLVVVWFRLLVRFVVYGWLFGLYVLCERCVRVLLFLLLGVLLWIGAASLCTLCVCVWLCVLLFLVVCSL